MYVFDGQSASRMLKADLYFTYPKEKAMVEVSECHQTIARYRLELIREAVVPYDTESSCHTLEQMVDFLQTNFGRSPQEVMGSLFLDIQCRVTGYTETYKGTHARLVVEPRGLLVPALLANASGVAIFHTHPSGDPTPSEGDMEFTRVVAEAARFLGLFLADHIILGGEGSYTSMSLLPEWPRLARQVEEIR